MGGDAGEAGVERSKLEAGPGLSAGKVVILETDTEISLKYSTKNSIL